MARTVEYGGRSWCHQQFYGLSRRLFDDGVQIRGWKMGTRYMCEAAKPKDICAKDLCYGAGDTPWLALCDAIQVMEEET